MKFGTDLNVLLRLCQNYPFHSLPQCHNLHPNSTGIEFTTCWSRTVHSSVNDSLRHEPGIYTTRDASVTVIRSVPWLSNVTSVYTVEWTQTIPWQAIPIFRIRTGTSLKKNTEQFWWVSVRQGRTCVVTWGTMWRRLWREGGVTEMLFCGWPLKYLCIIHTKDI
jgi:hypothetical protein